MALRSSTTHDRPDHRVTVATPGSVDRAPAPGTPIDPAQRRRRANAFAWGIVAALAIVVVLALVIQNSEEVILDLLWWSIRLPLAVVVFGAAVAGALVAGAVALGMKRRRRR
jgi:uncharacterized integral membrane protein